MNDSADKSGQRSAKGQFLPGNPGRPKGARDHRLVTAEKLMGDGLEDVVAALLNAAKAGDTAAAKLVLDRVLPMRKGRPVPFALPETDNVKGVHEAFGAVTRAVADGELSPEEGQAVAGILEARRKAIETVEIERRLAMLEAKAENAK